MSCHADGTRSQQLNTARCYEPIDTASQSRIRKQSSLCGREPHTWPSYACILPADVQDGTEAHCATVRLSVTHYLRYTYLSVFTTLPEHKASTNFVRPITAFQITHSTTASIQFEGHSGMTICSFFYMPTFRSSHHRLHTILK